MSRDESAEAFEGLGWAAWWLDEAEEVFEARERAYLLYRSGSRPAGAARMAIWLAIDHLDFRGAVSVANGWLARAARLLDGLGSCPERGWLAFHEGYVASETGDMERAGLLAGRCADEGRALDVPDLEMLGLGLLGSTLVARGEVSEGMALLDEATTLAISSEAQLPIAGAWTCCFLVSACEKARDYPRAFEWCREIEAFAHRYESRYMLGFCRTHYGVIDLVAGRWAEAEAALEEAAEAYARSRPALRPHALVALAELRRRQGRWRDVEQLLQEVGADEVTLLCRARMALDRGESLRALELAERRLRRIPAGRPLDRAPALEILVRACASRKDIRGGREWLEELRRVARLATGPHLEATVELEGGLLDAAAGDHTAARTALEDARDRFRAAGAPFEAALASVELARSLSALGRGDSASAELGEARRRLVDLGAREEVRRADRILADLGDRGARHAEGAGHTGDTGHAGLPSLTPREREVLREVAAGLTNREVAGRLHISEHTVHRHVANILRKMSAPSRAAAAARAARAGLLEVPGE